MTENKRDLLRVQHILDAIEIIDRHLSDVSEEDFLQNELLINLASMQIAIIGEAMNNLSDDFRKSYPQLAYRNAKDMRNYLIHEYFGVSFQILWKTYREDLPKLKEVLLPLRCE